MKNIIKVEAEGRKDIFLVEKKEIIDYIRRGDQEYIHNYNGNGGAFMIGADWEKESVVDNIEKSDRVAILLGSASRNNMGHSLAVVNNETGLEMFDVKISLENLKLIK